MDDGEKGHRGKGGEEDMEGGRIGTYKKRKKREA